MTGWGGGPHGADDRGDRPGNPPDPWAAPPRPEQGTAETKPPAGQGPPGWPPAGTYPPPGQYPPPGYDPQAAAYGYPPVENSGKAIAILVLGISSLVLLFSCFIGIIPAIVALAMSPSARREISSSGGRVQGGGMVTAGVVMSWVTVGITVLIVAGFAGLVAVGDSSGY